MQQSKSNSTECIHFVTGKLAEFSLRRELAALAPRAGFEYTIQVLNITVAALMTAEWVRTRIDVPPQTTRVLLPGYCRGELEPLVAQLGLPVERGPHDLRRLDEYFGHRRESNYGDFDIEIIAEINHAPQWRLADILAVADQMRRDGADLIDVGCNPGECFSGVGEVVRALRDQGHRVSIDSLDPAEIAPAVRAGAELVLSVNSSNVEAAPDWGCQVVVIPDDPKSLAGLDATVETLAAAGVPLRIDPIIEPIAFGFAESLHRYVETRRRYPDAEMMMGVGNLTELCDVDSAGINLLLLGFCQELGVRSILTTQVINWARSSVRECDLARRLVYHAVTQRTLPKHLEPRLVALRDVKRLRPSQQDIAELAASIRDNNYRLSLDEAGVMHLFNGEVHLCEHDPFLLFEKLLATEPRNLDPGHAFYLGYEAAKAVTARTLDKNYEQDRALDWGYLTVEERSHRLERQRRNRPDGPQDGNDQP